LQKPAAGYMSFHGLKWSLSPTDISGKGRG